MLVLVLPPVSSRVIGFMVASPCLWGKLQNISFSHMFPTVEIGGCLARKTCFGAPTCLVSSLRFPGGVAVSMGEAAKCVLFVEEVSHEMLVFLHLRVSSRVSGLSVASPCLWGKLRTPPSTLYIPHSTIYTLDSTLYT